MSIGDKEVCANCKHYEMIETTFGECKRYPPKTECVRKFFMLKYYTAYPEVKWLDTCGEFIIKQLDKE